MERENVMRKTNSRPSSFDASSSTNSRSLFNEVKADVVDYFPGRCRSKDEETGDEYDRKKFANDEYNVVRRGSHKTHNQRRVSPTAGAQDTAQLAPTIDHSRRYSPQQNTPEFVITTSSKIPDNSSFSYSTGDQTGLLVGRNYEQEDRSRYIQNQQYVRRKSAQLEQGRIWKGEERRWSSDNAAFRKARSIEYTDDSWNSPYQPDRSGPIYREQCDHRRAKDSSSRLLRPSTPIPTPPAIVTSTTSPGTSPNAFRKSSAGQVSEGPDHPPRKSSYLLTVPGDDDYQPPAPATTKRVSRSKSHSTPSSPDQIKLHGASAISHDQRSQRNALILAYDQNYRKGDRRRKHSADQAYSGREMHSPYRYGHWEEAEEHYGGQDDGEGQYRKHSYAAEWTVDGGQRTRQLAELRRIASSAACNAENGQRRRMLPPTPDQLQLEKMRINYGAHNSSSPSSSLPSQQAPVDADSSSAGGCRRIATALEQPSLIERRPSDKVLSHGHRRSSPQVGRFNQDERNEEETESALRSFRRARRATAIADTAMIPDSSPTITSPRATGRVRKLPDTPTDPKSDRPPSTAKMTVPMARQRTVGDLLGPQQSPPTTDRHNPPSRRVSEQMFPARDAKPIKAILAQARAHAKWPSSDPDVKTNTAVTSQKSPEHYPFQIPPSRPRASLFSQLQQNSVSSSCSVPDLITTPPNATCPGAGPDAAPDSGHGSGAESGPGDGTTVSGSSSWPDAIGAPGSESGLGQLHFTLQYFPVRKRLRVSVIKAERLAGQLRMDLELHTFVKLCLMPGKVQKQRGSRIVKRTRDATFNEEFFFDNVTLDDLETRWVYLRLCHQAGKQFQKDVAIGQVDVQLKEVMTQLVAKQEIKLCQELKPKQIKKLGRLQIGTCLESEASRLTININRVDDLPKFGISGAPDPFVRITVEQNGKIQTKQSRTLKNTCNAVFREAVMFLVSTKREDLDNTKIVMAVHDNARAAAGNEVIGRVYLGQLASDKLESDQWRNTVTNPGREFKASHSLKLDPNSAAEDDLGNSNGD